MTPPHITHNHEDMGVVLRKQDDIVYKVIQVIQHTEYNFIIQISLPPEEVDTWGGSLIFIC